MISQSIDTLEDVIESEKTALRRNFHELQERARNAVSWRTQVQRHPFGMFALALGGGFLLASAFRPGRISLRGVGSAIGGVGSAIGAVAPVAGQVIAGSSRTLARRRRRNSRRGRVAEFDTP